MTKNDSYFFFKRLVLKLLKYSGFFTLLNFFNRRKIKIICLHGISFNDEHQWFPSFFMSRETLIERLDYIEKNFKVISLDQALELQKNKVINDNYVVITADDGFYNNYKILAYELVKRKMPATFYVSTKHVIDQRPVLRHILSYMFYKTKVKTLNTEKLNLSKSYSDLTDHNKLKELKDLLIDKYEYLAPEVIDEFMVLLGGELEIDYLALRDSRLFHLMNTNEMRELDQGLIKIELHTHNHFDLDSPELADTEIELNKSILKEHLGRDCAHFCYPRGIWSKKLWPILRKHQILSATSGEFGFFDQTSDTYSIPRILDSANVSKIEFEAEIVGLSNLLRKTFK